MKRKWILLGTLMIMLICSPITAFGNPVTVRNLVGTWDLVNTDNVPSDLAVQTFDFFADGTGIESSRFMGMPISTPFRWQLRSGNRLQRDGEAFGTQFSSINTVELSERGTLLIFHIDGNQNIGNNRPGRTMYRKR